MISIYVYIIIIVLCYTLNPFFKKILLRKFNIHEYILANHILITLFIVFYAAYVIKTKRCSLNCFSKLSKTDYLIYIGGALTTVIATFVILKLVSMEYVSYVVSNIQSLVILSTLLLGYFIFNEKLTIVKGIGILLIVCGLYLLNKKAIKT